MDKEDTALLFNAHQIITFLLKDNAFLAQLDKFWLLAEDHATLPHAQSIQDVNWIEATNATQISAIVIHRTKELMANFSSKVDRCSKANVLSAHQDLSQVSQIQDITMLSSHV